MASRTPLHGGPLVAAAWILGQIIIWTSALAATAFLTLLLAAMTVAAFDPTNWKGALS